MAKIAWTSDIHLDRLTERDYQEFKDHLLEIEPDLLLISGDIAEGQKVFESLSDLGTSLQYPICFVLGNHDFYFGDFSGVRERIRGLVAENTHEGADINILKNLRVRVKDASYGSWWDATILNL